MGTRLRYLSPELHIMEAKTEAGFALSAGTGAFDEGGVL